MKSIRKKIVSTVVLSLPLHAMNNEGLANIFNNPKLIGLVNNFADFTLNPELQKILDKLNVNLDNIHELFSGNHDKLLGFFSLAIKRLEDEEIRIFLKGIADFLKPFEEKFTEMLNNLIFAQGDTLDVTYPEEVNNFDNKKDTLMVFCHGLGGGTDEFFDFQGKVSDKFNADSISLEWNKIGNIDNLENWLKKEVAAINNLVREKGKKKVILFGYSLGVNIMAHFFSILKSMLKSLGVEVSFIGYKGYLNINQVVKRIIKVADKDKQKVDVLMEELEKIYHDLIRKLKKITDNSLYLKSVDHKPVLLQLETVGHERDDRDIVRIYQEFNNVSITPKKNVILFCQAQNDKIVGNGMSLCFNNVLEWYNTPGKTEPKIYNDMVKNLLSGPTGQEESNEGGGMMCCCCPQPSA